MAVIGSAEVVVGPSFKGFQGATAKEMAKAGGVATNSFANATQKAGIGSRMAGTIGKGLMTGVKVTGGAIAGILGVSLVKGFQRLNAIEQATAKLRGLGNSAKVTQSIMDNALAAVKGTAFGLDEAATVAANAVAAGIKPGQDLERTLKLVGDAATIGGTSMAEMGSIFNKVATSGKVQADVMNQLNDRGIPIVQLLGKSMGKTSAQIQQLSKDGKINFQDFQKAMELGMGGAALKSGNTFMGAFKNMQAALGRFGAAFLEKLFPKLRKSFVNLTTFIDNMTEAVGPIANVIGTVLGGALEKVTGAMAKFDPSGFLLFFKTLQGGDLSKFQKDMDPKVFNRIVVAGVKVSGILGKIKGAFLTVKDAMSGVGKGTDVSSIFGNLESVANKAGPTLANLGSALPSIISGVGKGVVDFFNALTPALKAVGPVAGTLGNTLGKVLGTALQFVADHIDTIVKFLPAIIAGMLAYRAATQLTAAASIALQTAQLKALPVTVANNALRVVANFLERQNALATLKSAAAKDVETTSEVAGNTAKKKSLIQMAAMKAAQLAQAVASKAVAAAQWLVNAAMSANPIGLVVIAIAALVAGFIIAYKKSETFRKIVNGALNGVKAAFTAVWSWIRDNFIPFFTKTLPATFRAVIDWVKKNWKSILGWIVNPVGSAVKLVLKHKDEILGAFTNLRKNIAGGFKKAWSVVSTVLSAPVKAGYGAVKDHLSSAKARFDDLKTNISTKWKKGWASAKSWISDAVGKGKDAVATNLGSKSGVRAKFNDLKTWTKDTWKKGWAEAKGWISDPVGKAKSTIQTHRDTIKKVFNSLDEFGRKVFGPNWDKMKARLTKPVDDAKAYLKRIFAKGAKGGFLTLFSDMVKNAGAIFGRIKDVLMSPVRAAINAINAHLIKGGINWLLTKLGVAKENQVKWIPTFDTGGIFMKHRYTPGKDIGVAALSGYESIMRPEFTRAAGEPWVNAANAAAKRGGVAGAKSFLAQQNYGAYASGGVVKPTRTGRQNASYAGHSGIDFYGRDGDPILATTAGRITYVGSGRGYGNAIFEVSDKGMPMVYGHTSAYNVKSGQVVKAGQLIGKVGHTGNVRPPGPAGAHLHFEIAPSGFAKAGNRALTQSYLGGSSIASKIIGGISSALDFLKGLAPVEYLKKHVTLGNLGGGAFGAGLSAKIPGLILDKASEWIDSKVNAFTANDAGVNASWSGASIGSLGRDQLNVAASIIKTAKSLGFGQRGAIIGLMTALQESTLRELAGGDRDSVGPFQQRASWGSFAKRKNAASSAAMFFNGGDGGQPGLRSKNWRSGSLGALAQAVQVSAYPSAYAKWEALARQLVTRGYSSGTLNARSGLAWVHRNELVDFRGGERVYNDSMLRSMAESNQVPAQGFQPGDRVIFEVEGTPLTAVVKRTLTSETRKAGIRA